MIIVGELNPYGADPRFALWDEPNNAAGARLRRIFGIDRETYRRRLARHNLCVGAWDRDAARLAAARVAAQGHRVVVMLGVKVKTAFGLAGLAPFEMDLGRLALPHPSGRCLAWNDPAARVRTLQLLRLVAPEIPWGTAS